MNTDFRLSVGIFTHTKFVKLRRRVGEAGALALIQMLSYVAMNHPDGDLRGMDDDDIAIAAGYGGDAPSFVQALLDLGWLDRSAEGSLSVHDWATHNPWAADAPKRTQSARNAANTRWEEERLKKDHGPTQSEPAQPALPLNTNGTAGGNAPASEPQCAAHDSALPVSSNRNAPLLSSPILPPPNPSLPSQTQPTNQPSDARDPDPPPGDTGPTAPPGLEEGCVGVLRELIRFEPDEGRALALLRRFDCAAVRWQIRAMDWRLEKGREIGEPLGYLVNALEKKLPLPADVRLERDTEADREKAEAAEAARLEAERLALAQRAGEEALEAAWGALPEAKRLEIGAEAAVAAGKSSVVLRDRLRKVEAGELTIEAAGPALRRTLRKARHALMIEHGLYRPDGGTP